MWRLAERTTWIRLGLMDSPNHKWSLGMRLLVGIGLVVAGIITPFIRNRTIYVGDFKGLGEHKKFALIRVGSKERPIV